MKEMILFERLYLVPGLGTFGPESTVCVLPHPHCSCNNYFSISEKMRGNSLFRTSSVFTEAISRTHFKMRLGLGAAGVQVRVGEDLAKQVRAQCAAIVPPAHDVFNFVQVSWTPDFTSEKTVADSWSASVCCL